MSKEVIDVDKELEDYGIKENAYLELEQNYHQLLNEIGADSSTDKFKEEIEKLYRTFQVAVANERMIRKLWRELKKKYSEEQHKSTKYAEKMVDEAKEKEIWQMKYMELQKAHQLVKEERQKELISKTDMSHFSDKFKDDYSADENQIEALERERDSFKKELDLATKNYQKLDFDFTELLSMKDKVENKLKEIKEENVMIKEENTKSAKDKQKLEKELLDAKDTIEQLKVFKTSKMKEIDELKLHIEHFQRQYDDVNLKSAEFKADKEKLQTEKSRLDNSNLALMRKIELVTKDYKECADRESKLQDAVKKIEKEKERLKKESHEKSLEIDGKTREIGKINKERGIIHEELEKKAKDNKAQYALILSLKKQMHQEADRVHDKELENRNLEKNMHNKENLIKDLEVGINNQEGKAKESKELYQKLKEEYEEIRKANNDLEKQRDKTTEENTKLKNKIDHLLEDVRLRENRIQELQKKVTECEKKMKMQREVYDAVRRDKNLYFKNLIETQDDLVDKQNLLNFNKKEIEQLKSDLKKKDENIVGLKSELSTLIDALKTREMEAERNKNDSKILKENNARLEKEIERLKVIVEDTAKDNKKLKEEYKQTVINRDNLSSQLIRRNDEVSLLHEKIMVLTTKLSMKEKEFQATKDEVNFYIRENRNLIRELHICHNYKETANKYAKEIINLHKELLREKNLNKALTEEIESSEKLFHRKRRLEAIDPDSLEMHYKINLLQKRLITKTEECVEKEITIQDLTKELSNCKKIANKRPTYEIEESIKLYKQELQKNAEKMKAVIAERNLFENQAEDFKTENNRVKKENTEIQMKYNEMKIRLSRKQTQKEEAKRSMSKI